MTALRATYVDEAVFYVPTDPPPPIEFEEPPVDIDVCSHCDGHGVIVVGRDEADRPLDEPCTWCDGTGDRRGWAGAA